jgi:hypothetical protein
MDSPQVAPQRVQCAERKRPGKNVPSLEAMPSIIACENDEFRERLCPILRDHDDPADVSREFGRLRLGSDW